MQTYNFQYFAIYSWASLPEYFRNCPVITIDHNVVQLQLLGSVSLQNHMPGVSEEMDMSLVCNELPSELEQSEISTQADAEHVENVEQTALTLRDYLQSLQEFPYAKTLLLLSLSLQLYQKLQQKLKNCFLKPAD